MSFLSHKSVRCIVLVFWLLICETRVFFRLHVDSTQEVWYNFTWDATFDQKDDVPLAKAKRQPKAKCTGSTDGVEVVSVKFPNMKQLSFPDSLERFQVQTADGANTNTTATAHQAGDASGHLQTEMF